MLFINQLGFLNGNPTISFMTVLIFIKTSASAGLPIVNTYLYMKMDPVFFFF